jgi:hypothetical protein
MPGGWAVHHLAGHAEHPADRLDVEALALQQRRVGGRDRERLERAPSPSTAMRRLPLCLASHRCCIVSACWALMRWSLVSTPDGMACSP